MIASRTHQAVLLCVSVSLWFVAAGRVRAEPPDLRTVAEKTDYRATAAYADVVALMDQLAAASPLIRRGELGKTVEGRTIPMLTIADPPITTAAEARAQVERDGKLIVFAFGNIHAGEVDGKEALPMLARELIHREPNGSPNRLLKDLIVVLAPIYNCDGNERVAKDHRPGQIGPEEGMGIRENADGLDLNRDFIKVEAPETAGLVKFLVEWDPHVVIDTHTTNGSYHRYVITYAGPKAPANDPGILCWTRESFFPALSATFNLHTGKQAFWYGSFEGEFTDQPRGHTRWESFPAEARFGTTYVGMRNRISILSEAYSYSTFKERVLSTRDFVRCSLELVAANKERVRTLLRDADRRSITLGEDYHLESTVAIRSRATAWPNKVKILGFEEVAENGRMKSTGVEKEYDCELWDNFIPEKSATRPWGYLIEDSEAARRVIAKLRQHGIEVREFTEDSRVQVESFTITEAKPASRDFQKHVLVRLAVTAKEKGIDAKRGWHVIHTGQPLGTLACYLLEPECEDGLAAWNYYDPWIELGEELPVYRMKKPAEGKRELVK